VSAADELLRTARAALELYVDVVVDADGALSFVHSGVPCAVQAVQLAEGLVVLSTTCVLAWDLEPDPRVEQLVARLGSQVQFGGLGLVQLERTADVTLRYAFPAAGLQPEPLATLLLLVVSGASRARTELREELGLPRPT
jgi:hypothetical protein